MSEQQSKRENRNRFAPTEYDEHGNESDLMGNFTLYPGLRTTRVKNEGIKLLLPPFFLFPSLSNFAQDSEEDISKHKQDDKTLS